MGKILNPKKLNTPVLRAFVIFAISFFLLITLLTSFVLIPKINLAIESQHGDDSERALELEVELLERFIENHRKILRDLSNFPVLTNAVLLASAENPDFIDLVDNFLISGEKARLVLQDIAGESIYQTGQNLIGSYNANQKWIKTLLAGDIPFHFQLLDQKQDQFTFTLSIPVKYGANIEGILSAEITASLQKVFSPNVIEQGAIRLTQGSVSVQTNDNHIRISREFSTKLTRPNLALTYIADVTPVLAAEVKLRNTILLTLFAGLVISFCIFALFGYTTLAGSSDAERSIHKSILSRAYLIPVVIAMIGIAATVSAHMIFKNLQDEKIKQTILSDTNEQIRTVKKEVAFSLQAIHSLKSFYDASLTVDRQDFNIFTKSLLENNVDIKALEWIPKVIHSQRAQNEAQARFDGLTPFKITERHEQGMMVPATPRDLYFPVYYVEPLQGNEAAVGFDLASSKKRLAALHEARDSGKPVATARITLVQEGKEQQAGLLIFNPVYKDAPSYNSTRERKKHLKGFVLMVLRLGDMINSALGDNTRNVDIFVEDITDTAENIFSSLQNSSSQELASSSVLDIAGRQWRVTATPRMEVYESQQTLVPWFVLIGGFIFTALIASSLTHLIRRRQVIEGIVEQRTQEVQEVRRFQDLIMSNIPDLLYVKDDEFRIVQANPAFLKVYSKDEQDDVIGTTTLEKYDADEREAFLLQDKQALKSGYAETNETITLPDGNSRTLFTKKVRFEDMRGNKFVLGLGRDITDIQQAEAALKESEDRYEVAVCGSAVGLWDWNVKTGELFWSDRFKEILGISDEEFSPEYEYFSELVHPEDREKTEGSLFGHLENKTPYDVEHRLKHANGTYIWLHSRGQAIWDEEGNATRMAGSVFNISNRKKSEEEILRSYIELERFAYIASHDLQEPLRMVTSFTTLLEKRYAEKLDDQAKEYIAFASNGARRMQELVLDLLEYARVGQEAERYESTDANKTLNIIQENLQESINSSNAQITYNELPVIFTNPIRFMRVLQNLIGNALKYQNTESRPKIHISATQRGEAWLFSVKDNGIGMRQEYCEKIFEPFKRLHRKNEFTGTGIGLAICRKIVEGFGGVIYADSTLGEGSTFYFTIPLRLAVDVTNEITNRKHEGICQNIT